MSLVGLAAYITVKKRTNEKKRVDMQKKLAAQAEGESRLNTQDICRKLNECSGSTIQLDRALLLRIEVA